MQKNIKIMKIEEIFHIQSGYQERIDYDNYNNRGYRLIQGKDINKDNSINWAHLDVINVNRDYKNYIVNNGDLLFQARGSKHSFVFVDKDEENTIAGHTFYILKLKSKEILPKYLWIILNSNGLKSEIDKIAGGAIISFITKSNLSNIEIPIPSIDEQRTIINLYNVIEKKRTIINTLSSKYDKIIIGILNEQIFKGVDK